MTTLPLTSSNPLRAVTGLARQIALPAETEPLRFPSFPALERTAVMGFNQPATVPLGDTTAPTAFAVFRQACYPVWAETLPTNDIANAKYVVDYSLESQASLTPTLDETVYLPMRKSILDWAVTNREATTSRVGLAGGNSLLSYPILGADDHCPGPEFVYVPKLARYTVIVTGTTPFDKGTRVKVGMERWTSPGESETSVFSQFNIAGLDRGGAAAVAQATKNSWIRPTGVSFEFPAAWTAGTTFPTDVNVTIAVSTFLGSSYTTSTLTMGIFEAGESNSQTTKFFLPIARPEEFKNSALPWYATRVTAAAMLGTNVTQVLNKGGTVLCGRVSPAVQSAFEMTTAYLNALHPAEKAFLPLETGVYTYAPPSTDLIMFHDYTINTSSGAKLAPTFRLDNDSLYNFMYLSSPGGLATETLAITSTWHLEFRTSSALFQIAMSPMTIESLHQAQLALASSGFFFENPEHDKILSRVIASARRYVPEALAMVNPTVGRIAKRLMAAGNARYSVKPKSGPKMPPATSAAGSGITKPNPKQKQGGKGKGKGKVNGPGKTPNGKRGRY